MLGSLFGPFGVAVLVVGALVAVGSREWDRVIGAKARWMAVGVIALAAVDAGWVAWRVAVPPTPLAAAELHVGESLEVPASGPIALMVRGELPSVSLGEAAAARYVLAVHDGDRIAQRLKVEIEEHWEARRIGKNGTTEALVTHDEARLDLAPELAGHPLRIEVAEGEAPEADDTVSVAAIPAPPAASWLEAGGALLVLGGALVDRVQRSRTHFAVTVGVLGAFAVTLLTGVTPHGSAQAVVTSAMAAGMMGGLGGLLVRAVVGWLPLPIRSA